MSTGLENLKIYQMAEALEIELHKITEDFPTDEKFRSVDQIRRSSASVTNNISEAYARYSYEEKIRFLYIAKGEATETKMNMSKSAKKGFLLETLANGIAARYTELLRVISGYIKFIKQQDMIS